MQISNYIKKAAEEALKQDNLALPMQLAGTQDFYLAAKDDESILAHDAIKDASGVEYKIGTKK
jgi:hypothetical protein